MRLPVLCWRADTGAHSLRIYRECALCCLAYALHDVCYHPETMVGSLIRERNVTP